MAATTAWSPLLLVLTADPCVLRLIAPLEETRTQLVFITEPVFSSLSDLLGGAGAATGAPALPPALASERRQLQLSGGSAAGGAERPVGMPSLAFCMACCMA